MDSKKRYFVIISIYDLQLGAVYNSRTIKKLRTLEVAKVYVQRIINKMR